MSALPNSPQPRATVQLARCVPRSSTGLVPSTFKKAITDATSPDKWIKLPPKPLPEVYPFRGDRVIALRNAHKTKYKSKAKHASTAKATCNNQYKKTEKDEMSKKREEGWDSYFQGDKCMYQLSNTECANRVAIRKKCVSFLKQLAKERDNNGDRSSEENIAKLEKPTHMLPLPLKTQNVSAISHQKKCNNLDTVTVIKNDGNGSRKNLMALSKVSRSLPRATTSRSSRFTKDDKTIRSLVTTAIDDDESVIAARQALESVRRRLKLNKYTEMETTSEASRVPRLNQAKIVKASNKKPSPVTNSSPSSCLICCDEEETIRSSVIASIDDNESVVAARKALEAIRTHFKLGTVTSMNADTRTSYSKAHSSTNSSKEAVWTRSNEDQSIISDVTKSVREDNSVIAARAALEEVRSKLEVLGLFSSTSNSFCGSNMTAYGETNAPEASLESCSRKGPDFPAVVAFDSLPLHPSTCKPQCGAEKDLFEARHYCDQFDMEMHSLQSDNLCSDPHPPLFDQLSSTDVMEKTLSIDREIQNSYSSAQRIIPSDVLNHDGESDSGFADDSYAKQIVAEAPPSVSFMEIGDAVFDNEIWNPLVSWDGRGTLLLDDDRTWCHSAHATPRYVDTFSEQVTSPFPSVTTGKIEKHFSSPCVEVDGGTATLSPSQADQPYPLNATSAFDNNPMKSIPETAMISILNGSKEDWIASPSQSTLLYATPSAFLPDISETTPTITICDGSAEDWTLSI